MQLWFLRNRAKEFQIGEVAAMIKKSKKNIVELLEEHELIIAALYKLFAQKFPDYKRFWTTMALEENIHASWIKKIYPLVKSGKIKLSENKFKRSTVKRSLRHVQQEIKKFKKSKTMAIAQAISTAIDIENFPMESKFFDIYSTDSQELETLLQSLRDAFIEHRNRLLEALEKLNYIEDMTHA
jgi:hypothetical protein